MAVLGAPLSSRGGVVVQGIGVPLASDHLLALRAAHNLDQVVDGEVFLVEARPRAESLNALDGNSIGLKIGKKTSQKWLERILENDI